jgi:ATP-dependent helicase HrpA
MIREKVQAYLKALPKALRNRETPLGNVVTAFLVACDESDEALPEALRGFLSLRWQTAIAADVWDDAGMPDHLRANLRIVDAAGRELAAGRDLRALRERLGEAAQLTFAAADPGIERAGLRDWDCGALPPAIRFVRDGRQLTGYPALVDEGETVAVRLLDTEDAALRSHRGGVLRLLRIALREQVRQLEKGWPGFNAVALALRGAVAPERLLADSLEAICDRAFIGEDALPRDPAQFEVQKGRARTRLAAVRDSAQRLLAEIGVEYGRIAAALGRVPAPQRGVLRGLELHRDRLVFPGFMMAHGWEHLGHLPRYLKAIVRRIQRFADDPARDARHATMLESWHQRWTEQMTKARRNGEVPAELAGFRWWIEELAVAVCAQELRTPFPVSQKRLEKRWMEITR